jgi:hypothetical protein
MILYSCLIVEFLPALVYNYILYCQECIYSIIYTLDTAKREIFERSNFRCFRYVIVEEHGANDHSHTYSYCLILFQVEWWFQFQEADHFCHHWLCDLLGPQVLLLWTEDNAWIILLHW